MMFDFYSRPCGRGDTDICSKTSPWNISTHAPAGGATKNMSLNDGAPTIFLLTPLREGRRGFSR